MMKDTSLHEVQATAGEMLKSLREDRKLTPHDIAAKLYLDVKIIEALELNNFSVLPAATYTRGYLRSYARLVGADAEMIIALYNNIAPAPPEIIPEIKHPTQISSRDRPVRAITWMICLLLALLLLSWLHSFSLMPGQEDRTEDPLESTGSQAQELKESRAKPMEENPVTAGLSAEFEPVSEMEASLSAPNPAAGEGDGDAIEATVGTDTGLNTETVSEALDPDIQVPGTVTVTESDTGAITGLSAGDDAPQIMAGTDTLKIQLTADSWIEIYDRSGNKLYHNLARTGDEISLTGAAPFLVKLGFSQGVILEFNGVNFDPAPHSRAGVASFTLE